MPAGPERVRRVLSVMGTVVSIDVRRITRPVAEVGDALDAVHDWLHWVDRTFSPYRPDSQINRLARRELRLANCHPYVRDVLHACADAQAATDGSFTAVFAGRIDPTGLVKGWAAQRASRLLRDAGLRHHAIGAGGDVVCAGEPAPGAPWRIGISDPHRPAALLTVVRLRDAAVATSGTAERGAHVVNPRTGRPARTLAGASVVGPDLGFADAYATAAVAADDEYPPWLAGLAGYEAITVPTRVPGTEPIAGVRWTPGFLALTEGAVASTAGPRPGPAGRRNS